MIFWLFDFVRKNWPTGIAKHLAMNLKILRVTNIHITRHEISFDQILILHKMSFPLPAAELLDSKLCRLKSQFVHKHLGDLPTGFGSQFSARNKSEKVKIVERQTEVSAQNVDNTRLVCVFAAVKRRSSSIKFSLMHLPPNCQIWKKHQTDL